MKFPQLPIGSRFEFEGVQYIKSGPLTATASDGSGQRLIKRSAIVTPLDGRPTEPALQNGLLERQQVREALQTYQQRSEALLEGRLDEESREALQAAWWALEEALGL